MEYSKETLLQGHRNQIATNETPETFGTLDGVAQVRPTRDLATQSQRMAGELGARALVMMANPEEIKRTTEWETKFENNAPQGAPWKMAKMTGNMPPPPM